MHGPGHGEPLAVAKRRVDGEPALLHVGQQMGKVALNGEQPLMLTKRIAQRRVRMVQRGQRRGRLCIQPGVSTQRNDESRTARCSWITSWLDTVA